MKKILLGLLICGSMFSAAAQVTPKITPGAPPATTTDEKYSYYPSENVYYNQTTKDYWYQEKGATEWTRTQELPATITVEKAQQYPITYGGEDPWKNNASDIKKYKVKKNGSVKEKTKDKE